MNFSIGEVVRLKSGGPRMTIVKIGDFSPERFNPGVLCVWFEGAKNTKMYLSRSR
ncbi:MAG: DUF2158 domain-containing protein, partial [Proteobacteria bacterium]|nr:DUF2158 domain-containing protein [Pseudomonadota bacterium]